MDSALLPAVLVVETDKPLRRLLAAVLRREGYSVCWNDYRGALRDEVPRCERYAAIVVQVTPMPSPNDRREHEGVVLLRALRSRSRCAERTIALTTSAGAMPEPICRVLAAPFDLDDFVSAIRTAHRHERVDPGGPRDLC